MPEIPVYKPAAVPAPGSGSPRTPLSLGQSALPQLGAQISQSAFTLGAQAAAIERQQQESQWTVEAEDVLAKALDRAESLRQTALHGDYTAFDGETYGDPLSKKQAFRSDLAKLFESTYEQAAGIGERRVAQRYVATHLRPALQEKASRLDADLNKLWSEQHQLGVLQSVDTIKKQAVAALDVPGDRVADHLSRARSLVTANTGIVFTAEQAHTLLTGLDKEVKYQRGANLVRSEALAYLTLRAQGQPFPGLEGIEEPVLKEFDEVARQALTFRDARLSMQEAKTKERREQVSGSVRMELESRIVQGTLSEDTLAMNPRMRDLMPGASMELPNGDIGLRDVLTPGDFNALVTLAHARRLEEVRGENVKSDPTLATSLLSKLTSPNPSTVRSISESQILAEVKAKRLNWETASSLLKYRRERLDHFKTEVETQYDKIAQEGEQLVETLFRTTGLLDIDKQANQAMADALFEFRERWRQERGKVNEKGEPPNPLSWAYEIVTRHEKPILDRAMSDTQRRILGLRPDLQTVEKATKAFHEGRVSEAEFKQALALHERLEAAQRIQQSFQSTTSQGKAKDR